MGASLANGYGVAMTAAYPRLAIVTGADSGMGKATAELLATEGFDVGITYHTDRDGVEDTRAGIEQRGGARRGL